MGRARKNSTNTLWRVGSAQLTLLEPTQKASKLAGLRPPTTAESLADTTPADDAEEWSKDHPGFWLCFAPLPVLTYVKYAP